MCIQIKLLQRIIFENYVIQHLYLYNIHIIEKIIEKAEFIYLVLLE